MPPLDQKDPHVALGFQHAIGHQPPYRWLDRENQRRYDYGFLMGCGAMPEPGLTWTELEQLMRERGFVRDR